MKVFVALALCLAAVAAGPDEDIWLQYNRRMPAAYYSLKEPITRAPATGRIVGGVDAAIEDFPYQLSLRYYDYHSCGASIISDHWALSAAHCTDPLPPLTDVTLLAATANRLEGGVVFEIAEIVNHPEYNPFTFENDICVLRTAQPMNGINMQSIPLVPVDTYYPGGTRAVLSGWGLTSVPGSMPTILQMVDIPVIDQATCNASWLGWVTDDMLCAGELGRVSCNGDSGSPLVTGGRQIGVVSWGEINCLGTEPGVLVRVAHPGIRSFITNVTGV